MAEFYSHGKLLITSEYAVLDGAKALAIPTKFGQGLSISKKSQDSFTWKSFDQKYQAWFEADFKVLDMTLKLISTNDRRIAQSLIQIIAQAWLLSETKIELSGISVETHLEFDRNWGLGTSSTLINNIANWFQIDAFKLLAATFGGSGYDIACAQHSNPIQYQLIEDRPIVTAVNIDWSFKDNLYFVYLNQKQNSRSGISTYRKRNSISESHLNQLSTITEQLLNSYDLERFEALIKEHNSIVSHLLGVESIAHTLFKDFPGVIKNLGAWGGDFALVTSRENPKDYFQGKGFHTIFSYQQIAL